MDTYLHRGYIEFETLAPVFIGSGGDLNKKEYIYDRDKGEISIIDIEKMFDYFRKKNLSSVFEEYLLTPAETKKYSGEAPAKDLYFFLRDNHVPENVYRTWITGTEKVADASMNMRSAKQIMMFMRDAQGRPYIPGSSFKGMLRTTLEMRYLLENPEKAREIGQMIRSAETEKRNRYLSAEDKKIDVLSVHRELFRNGKNNTFNVSDQVNDALRGLYVGDSESIALENMCICEKIDLTTQGEERPLNLLRESIKPRVRIRIPITIDTTICPYTVKNLLEAIAVTHDYYKKVFMSRFAGAPQTLGNTTTFYLGGGTGYAATTVTYGALQDIHAVKTVSEIIDNTLPYKIKEMHKHRFDEKKGVSPHLIKCTRYNGKLYQMGTCCVMKFN